jgi:cytidine deaminase
MLLKDSTIEKLRKAAVKASKNAYCRYSRFRVGAAVLTTSGRIFTGCNVENASYGLTVCAERNAIFQAVASGARTLRAIAIFTVTDKPSPPCGACRQVIYEFGPAAEIFTFGKRGKLLQFKLNELLPVPFARQTIRTKL